MDSPEADSVRNDWKTNTANQQVRNRSDSFESNSGRKGPPSRTLIWSLPNNQSTPVEQVRPFQISDERGLWERRKEQASGIGS